MPNPIAIEALRLNLPLRFLSDVILNLLSCQGAARTCLDNRIFHQHSGREAEEQGMNDRAAISSDCPFP